MYKSYISSQLTCFLLDSGSGELNFGVDVTTNLRLEPKSLFVFFFSSSIWPPALSISQQRWLGSSEWHALLRGGNGTYYTKTCLSLLADTMDEKKERKKADYVLRVRFRLLSPLAGFLCTYDYLPSRRYLCLYLDEIATCMLHLRDTNIRFQIRKNRLKVKWFSINCTCTSCNQPSLVFENSQ